MMNRVLFLLVFVFVIQFPAWCHAAKAVVERGSNGLFYVRGINFVNIGGVEIELSYDSAALANPRISQGESLSSTMFMPNPALTPNKVKIAAISLSAINSGILATVQFDLKGTAPGTVSVSREVYATIQGNNTKPDNTQGSPGGNNPPAENKGNRNPNDESKTNPVNDPGNNGGTNGSGSGYYGGISMGTITLPPDQVESVEKKGDSADSQPLVTDLRKNMTIPIAGKNTSKTGDNAAPEKEAKDEVKSSIAYKSVLQKFNEFKGERGVDSLVALFAGAEFPGFRQNPPIVISDGASVARLTMRMKPSGKESPKFILQGANVKQLRGIGEDYIWLVDALPKKSTPEAKLTVVDGKRTLEFPLVVAPPVDTALGLKTAGEAEFKRYLASSARYDLNKDGKQDYVDDYIYTANYIVNMKITPEKLEEIAKKNAKELKKAEENKPSAAESKTATKVKGGMSSQKEDGKVKQVPSKQTKKGSKNSVKGKTEKPEDTKKTKKPEQPAAN